MRWAPSSQTRAIRALAFLFLPLAVAVSPTEALAKDPIDIVVDRAKVMRVSRPADTIIIGNPAIADATIQDNRTLIITELRLDQSHCARRGGQPIAARPTMPSSPCSGDPRA